MSATSHSVAPQAPSIDCLRTSLDGNCHRFRPEPPSAPAVPISYACKVNTTQPGEYLVTLSVTNSAGLTAYVTRTLVVLPACSLDEHLCEDKVSSSLSF